MLNNTYTTVSGDTWDIVAYKAYGNEMYMDTLIKANIEYKDTYIFPAGVVLTLPEIELTVSESLLCLRAEEKAHYVLAI